MRAVIVVLVRAKYDVNVASDMMTRWEDLEVERERGIVVDLSQRVLNFRSLECFARSLQSQREEMKCEW